MKTVTVPAMKAFTYQGRDVVVGDGVEMSAVDAAVHAQRGEVSLLQPYQRRDMRPVEAPAPDPAPAPAAPQEAPKRAAKRGRGRYRRRDMQAAP